MDGLENPVDWKKLFDLPKDFWIAEMDNIEKYLTDQINEDLPREMIKEIEDLRQRFNQFWMKKLPFFFRWTIKLPVTAFIVEKG